MSEARWADGRRYADQWLTAPPPVVRSAQQILREYDWNLELATNAALDRKRAAPAKPHSVKPFSRVRGPLRLASRP
jgi:hypothetical protein